MTLGSHSFRPLHEDYVSQSTEIQCLIALFVSCCELVFLKTQLQLLVAAAVLYIALSAITTDECLDNVVWYFSDNNIQVCSV